MVITKIDRKKTDCISAINSLEIAVTIAPSPLREGEEEKDAMLDLARNGLLQKFEYTVELLWKTYQNIYKDDGLDLQTPKSVLRHRFTELASFTEDEKISALLMIDHRNQIAHEYKDYIMQEIYPRIKNYASLMKKIAIDLL